MRQDLFGTLLGTWFRNQVRTWLLELGVGLGSELGLDLDAGLGSELWSELGVEVVSEDVSEVDAACGSALG